MTEALRQQVGIIVARDHGDAPNALAANRTPNSTLSCFPLHPGATIATLERASWALISRSHWAYMGVGERFPEPRVRGPSRLATGKLKEELKTLALRAAGPWLGRDRPFGAGIGPRQAGSCAKRVVFRIKLVAGRPTRPIFSTISLTWTRKPACRVSYAT